MTQNPLHDIATWLDRAGPSGIPSVCSAHPMVLEASMRATLPTQLPLLIEATCNQVNQDGGYTGMTPKDFRNFVEQIAAENDFPTERVILAGDHLGPNPWKSLPAEEAMEKAEVMISSFAAAGFSKLHLDCSMGCQGEPVALKDEETASRAARLAAAAESALPGGDAPKPVYVIGTEVPIPGGAMHALDELELTTPEDALRTVQVHETAFEQAGQSDAFTRVIAAVVQPGVEFGSHNVVDYNSSKAEALSATLKDMPGLVFEAHSTDYQTRANLTDLVQGRLCHPQGGARPDLRPAGGPLRPRRDRRGAFSRPAGRDSARDYGADHAGLTGELGQVLPRQCCRAGLAAAFLLQRPHSLLLATAGG